MEVRIGAELGVKNLVREPIKKFRPTHAESTMGRHALINKEYVQTQREMTAVKFTQARTVFQVTGNIVDVKA